MEIITVDNLSFTYPGLTRAALDSLSFGINKGQFVTLCGPSGCGKSTLLRQLKTALAPHGNRSGEILFEGQVLDKVDFRTQSEKIGFVQQSPDNQLVTDKVWHELAFGLESLGCDTPTIRGRVAEMASFFGIQNWFYKNVTELSGGQKQLLNLASIMVMHPDVLILDEPTSQLDPIAASDFLAAVGKINRELGTTVLITEHRLEEVFPFTDRVMVMDRGALIADGSVKEVGLELRDKGNAMFLAMPATMRIWASTDTALECPVTVRDGANWLKERQEEKTFLPLPEETIHACAEESAIELENVWFRYEQELPDVVKGLSLKVKKGEFYALLGGNGTGKSTSLSMIAGIRKPYRGEVRVFGSAGMLPQNPQTVFVKKTVREDLMEILPKGKRNYESIAEVVSLCRLGELLDRHPFDLSGGEQQRAALAKLLLLRPEILLLDEPTKGLDAEFKQALAEILKSLQSSGVTILMVSHDVEFCAEYADRCGLFFDGNIVSDNTPRGFFMNNSFYTTSAARMAKDTVYGAVTVGDVITVCGGIQPPAPKLREYHPAEETKEKKKESKSLPLWRKLGAGLSLVAVLLGTYKTLTVTDLSKLVSSEGLHLGLTDLMWFYLVVGGFFALALFIGRRGKEDKPVQVAKEKRALSKRTKIATGISLIAIPFTLFIGAFYFGNKNYYLFATLILLESMLPFALIFEGRKPNPRELVVIAVMSAIAVAGRAAFFMLPNFKPVMAIVIITGVGLGGEAGFLVGAMSMMVSNIMFGQGPWTPWQMFAMGIIGFLAGVLFRKGILRRSRFSLCVFGAICAVVIYGGIMNPASALMWAHTIEWKVLLSYYVTGFPVDLVHGAATALTLWFAAEPMLEKLDRMREKYGLLY